MAKTITKAELLAKLSAAGITKVTVDYSGSGDEGSINDVVYEGTLDIDIDTFTDWTDFYLAVLHSAGLDGYYDSEGGTGEIVIDVGAGTITVHHGWYETTAVYNDPHIVDLDVIELSNDYFDRDVEGEE